jgi:hypothetical protein
MSADNMSDLEQTLTDPRKKNVVFILFSFISFVLKKIYSKFRILKKKKKKKNKKIKIKGKEN